MKRVVLESQIISQFFSHNSDIAGYKWLTITYTLTPYFFLPITLCHITVVARSCEKLCDPRLFQIKREVERGINDFKRNILSYSWK